MPDHPDPIFIGSRSFDCTTAPDANGVEIPCAARYLTITDAPSGAACEIAFGGSSSPRIAVRAGQTIELAGERTLRYVYVFWTQIAPEPTEGGVEIPLPAEEKTFRLEWALEARVQTPPDKIAVYPKAGHAFTPFQGKIAVTGTAVQLIVDGAGVECDEFRVGGMRANAEDLYVGGLDVEDEGDGTGNGEPLAPGEKLAYPLFNTGILWINGTADDAFSVMAIHKRK